MSEITKFSIPTIYRGRQMRSRLEADTARFFDGLGIKWLYEPQSFLLEECGLHYWPDFYLPLMRTWVECKGQFTERDLTQIREFARMTMDGRLVTWEPPGTAYLLLSPAACVLWEQHETTGLDEPELVTAVPCPQCGARAFIGYMPSWRRFRCWQCGHEHGRQDWGRTHMLICTEGRPELYDGIDPPAPDPNFPLWP